ncbi:MAG: hypothetical protein D6675_13585 [Gemmatimonadetes bacterium]|nr:MAG: hypothetical protein D6675_13585 [Gemmatimonadota bacterium]
MGYDLYAEYPCIRESDVRRIVGDDRRAPYTELTDIYTRVNLLAQSVIADAKEFAKNGHFKYGGGYKSLLHYNRGKNSYTAELIEPYLNRLDQLGIYPPSVDIQSLPPYSFFLQFQFRLIRPYTSGDDTPFYIHDNPITKDPVFKLPMVRPSAWKGHLRAVASLMGYPAAVINRLFGDAKKDDDPDAEKWGRRGRLRTYPTFFDAIDLQVINPHDRKTKAGTVPVMLEVAPKGACGYFSLLYFPFDLISQSPKQVKAEVKEDLQMLNKIIRSTLTVYGFSAKKSKGFGQTSISFVRKKGNLPPVVTGKFGMSGLQIELSAPPQQHSGGGSWQAQLQAIKHTSTPASGWQTFGDFNELNQVIKTVVRHL